MSGMRKKDRNEVEHLRGIIRELKSENRNLRKQIGRSNKKVLQLEEHASDLEDLEPPHQEEEVVAKVSCPKCRGNLKTVDLGTRTLVNCEDCKYRKSSPKRGK